MPSCIACKWRFIGELHRATGFAIIQLTLLSAIRDDRAAFASTLVRINEAIGLFDGCAEKTENGGIAFHLGECY